MEHEISEGMGRVSSLDFAGDYAPIDLFRFSVLDPNNSDPGNRALTPLSTPSYFSINDGVTDIADWNNHKTGTQGDLDDWGGQRRERRILRVSDIWHGAGGHGYRRHIDERARL